jgi:hypothetical protein
LEEHTLLLFLAQLRYCYWFIKQSRIETNLEDGQKLDPFICQAPVTITNPNYPLNKHRDKMNASRTATGKELDQSVTS